MKIYLISPYSHEDPMVRHYRFEEAAKAAGELITIGHIVYSPIAHCHPIAIACNLPGGNLFWSEMNEEFMRWADIGVLLELDGWKGSIGVDEDIKFLQKTGKPFYDYETFLYLNSTPDLARGEENGREEV